MPACKPVIRALRAYPGDDRYSTDYPRSRARFLPVGCPMPTVLSKDERVASKLMTGKSC